VNILTILSQCRKYQYLSIFDSGTAHNPMGVVGLNPSFIKNGKNATASILLDIAMREGFDSIVITNLYGYITPDPKQLKGLSDPVGDENNIWIENMKNACSKILCIWGNNADKNRVEEILPLIKKKAYTIGFTKSGQPRHVLHTKKDAPLIKL
jgi:hypothetical protein